MTWMSPVLENMIVLMVAGNWDVVVHRIGAVEAQGLYEREESTPTEAARTERRRSISRSLRSEPPQHHQKLPRPRCPASPSAGASRNGPRAAPNSPPG